MVDDRKAFTADVLLKIGQELMPGCRCFEQDETGIDEAGLLFIGQAMQLGRGVIAQLEGTGVCPTAAPALLALLVHTALYDVAVARCLAAQEDRILDQMESINDEICRHLRHLRSRPRELVNRTTN